MPNVGIEELKMCNEEEKNEDLLVNSNHNISH